MGRLPRRIQQRSVYTRTPDNNLRINAPDGFLHDFMPMPWGGSVDLPPGGWWQGVDWDPGGLTQIGPGEPYYGSRTPTVGSPLTRPARHGYWDSSCVQILPAVTRCTEVIVNPVVSTPWLIERDDTVQRLPRWLVDPMGADTMRGTPEAVLPSPARLTGFAFWATVLTHALWWGRGGFMFQENNSDQPIPGTCRVVNPFQIDVGDDGRWVFLADEDSEPLSTDFDGRFRLGGVQYRMVVMRGLPPHDGVTPEGVLTRHFNLLRLGAHIHRYGESTFASGVPSGYLKVQSPNMTQDQADALKRRWMAAHSGDRRSVAVLNAVTDYTPVALSPVDADTDKLKLALKADVAHAFGLSASVLDTGDASNTYANVESRDKERIRDTLVAWGRMLMEMLTSVLPDGTTARVDWALLTRPQVSTQEALQLQQAGVLTAGEVRGLLGFPAFETDDPEPVRPVPETDPVEED